MKLKKIYKYILIGIFIFIFNINKVNAAGDITCKYEMYPVSYYVEGDNNVYANIQSDAKHTASLTYSYNSSKDKYSIKHNNSFTSLKSNKVKDSAFNKKVKNSGKCPNYIYATGKKVDEISGSELLSKTDKGFHGSVSGYKYPMVLVEQNGKKVETPSVFLLNHVMNRWTTVIRNAEKEFSESNCDSRLLDASKKSQVTNPSSDCQKAVENYEAAVASASLLKEEVEKSKVGASVVSKVSNWQKLSDFITKTKKGSKTVENEQKLAQTEEKISKANSDYCSLYCSETHCKSQTHSTAKTQCESSCNTNIKPKCDSAYNTCKGIQSSSDKTKCIQNALTTSGLDSSYVSDRTDAITEMQDTARELKTLISNAKATDLKISIGEGYKVQCSDVSMLHDLWVIIIIVAPALVLVMGTFDFLRATIAGDEQKMKKAWQNFPKRLLALVLLVLVPQIISIIVNISNEETASDSSLMYCIINGGE